MLPSRACTYLVGEARGSGGLGDGLLPDLLVFGGDAGDASPGDLAVDDGNVRREYAADVHQVGVEVLDHGHVAAHKGGARLPGDLVGFGVHDGRVVEEEDPERTQDLRASERGSGRNVRR
ncbi:uncharacterized protein BcabD6B2_01280 [Babesia caballi]|uniref:Uncharacterized protein n=1 Tax=Babesia caballi TaxID=5871 RepID=A0AAV4LLY6_BABCB|nr:hypothetical protein BcabD6B2_01280 [Babesia caballi]